MFYDFVAVLLKEQEINYVHSKNMLKQNPSKTVFLLSELNISKRVLSATICVQSH